MRKKYSLKHTILNEGFFDIFKKAVKAAHPEKFQESLPEDCPKLYGDLFTMIQGGFGEYDETLVGFVKDGIENGDIEKDQAAESYKYALERFKQSKEKGKPSAVDQQIARCIRDSQK